MNEEFLYEVRDAVAWLTLNREASRNSLSPGVLSAFGEALDRAEADGTLRAVCLTGAGDRVFCSGADLASFQSGDDPVGAPLRYARLLRRMLSFPLPLVARVNGHCLGGGLGLVLACDLAYGREGVRFTTPETRVGLFPMMVAPLLLAAVPRKQAMEMMLTARPMTATEAAALGLISRAVPDGSLDAAVEEVLGAIRAGAPLALRQGRQAIREIGGESLGEDLERLSTRLFDLLGTEDAAEGLSAFLQKRPPQWKGR
jgi:enoyl-CoA hydratase/carnithine racemase